MKCERCGHELDNDDLFCSHCGKAVFEEYMDEEDIWEHYKSDEVLRQEYAEKKKAEEGKVVPELTEKAEETETEPELTRTAEETETEPEPTKMETEPETQPEKTEETDEKIKTEDKETEDEETEEEIRPVKKADPKSWGIFWLVLLLCLIAGCLWGARSVKSMDREENKYYKTLGLEETKEEAEGETAAETETEPEAEAEAEAEPVPVPEKKQEYFKAVDPDTIDFGQFEQLSIVSTDQNSQNVSDNYDYSANSAVDGSLESSWQEGEDGVGTGAGIRLNLDGTRKVHYVLLYLGNWRNDEMWLANARPSVLTVQVGDSQSRDVEFSNEKKAFCLSFEEPVEASYLTFYIQNGYEGDRWNDNCISEIRIYE